jgi:hypothetical protein
LDDNIWEYPFGELDDDDDMFCRKPGLTGKPASRGKHSAANGCIRAYPNEEDGQNPAKF